MKPSFSYIYLQCSNIKLKKLIFDKVTIFFRKMSTSTRLFYLKESEVDQILFCDNSDNEDNFILDEEDIGFLEEDIQSVENTNHSGDYDAVVVIDPSTVGMPPHDVDSEPSTSQKELA